MWVIPATNVNQVFDFPLASTLLATKSRVWTGLDSDWNMADHSCKQWTSASDSDNGRVGLASATDSQIISEQGKTCYGHGYIYCVMQPTTTITSPIPGGTIMANTVSPIVIQFNNEFGVNTNSVSESSISVTTDDLSKTLYGKIVKKSESNYEFQPSQQYSAKTRYLVSVTGIKDMNNKLIPDAKFLFTAVEESKIIFVTHGHCYGEDIKTIDGADDKCKQEAKDLNLYGIYKAMIVADNVRGPAKNWVLKPDTDYFNLKSEHIGKTNGSGKFDTRLENYIYDMYLGHGYLYNRIWTGMSSTWTVSDLTCDNWKAQSTSGMYGTSDSLEIESVISYGYDYCSENSKKNDYLHGSKAHLYCVTQ